MSYTILHADRTFEATSLKSASDAWSTYRDKMRMGSRAMGHDPILKRKGKVVGRLSYNGKIWRIDGSLMFDPYAPEAR